MQWLVPYRKAKQRSVLSNGFFFYHEANLPRWKAFYAMFKELFGSTAYRTAKVFEKPSSTVGGEQQWLYQGYYLSLATSIPVHVKLRTGPAYTERCTRGRILYSRG